MRNESNKDTVLNLKPLKWSESNECVSFCGTEAPEELPPVEEESLEGENWAKPLAHLWQSRPPNLKKEREYNHRMGSKPPYCSICMLFHTYQQVIFTEAASLCCSGAETVDLELVEYSETKFLTVFK